MGDFALDRTWEALGNLGIDVGQKIIALLRQLVGGVGQLPHFRRPRHLDAKAAIGRMHQAKLFRHAQQALHVLPEEIAQDANADQEADRGNEGADRQAWQQHLAQNRLFLGPEVAEKDCGGQPERPGHQQSKNDNRQQETVAGIHSSVF